jgi:hypothetical protein
LDKYITERTEHGSTCGIIHEHDEYKRRKEIKKTQINKTRKNSSESYRIYNEHKDPRMKTRWERVRNDGEKKGGAHIIIVLKEIKVSSLRLSLRIRARSLGGSEVG